MGAFRVRENARVADIRIRDVPDQVRDTLAGVARARAVGGGHVTTSEETAGELHEIRADRESRTADVRSPIDVVTVTDQPRIPR